MNNNHVHGENCNHDHDGDHEEFSTEELVQVTEDKIDALINLLMKKKMISEDELSKELEDLYEEEPE